MKRSQLLTGALALIVSATVACNRADTSREAREAAAEVRTVAARAGERLADSWLTAKVQAKFFADDDVKARYIDVTSRDGRVTLQGFVESDALRQQALQIARGTDGVKQVEDRLLIGQAPSTASNVANPSAVPSSSAVGTGGAIAPDAVATVPDDSMVTSLVQARYFVDPGIKARSIEVSTNNGIVTLRGHVASDNERAQALLLAQTTQGVQRVEDGLTIDASLGQPAAASSSPTALPSSSIAGAAAAAPGAAEPAAANRSAATGPAAADRSAATGPAAADRSAAVGTSGARGADSTLEAAVRSKLTGDAQLKASGIEVTARDGVVMLQGTAASQALKQRALTMARETEGAMQVVDRITVGRRK
jgi:hyperosmotically inducible protein